MDMVINLLFVIGIIVSYIGIYAWGYTDAEKKKPIDKDRLELMLNEGLESALSKDTLGLEPLPEAEGSEPISVGQAVVQARTLLVSYLNQGGKLHLSLNNAVAELAQVIHSTQNNSQPAIPEKQTSSHKTVIRPGIRYDVYPNGEVHEHQTKTETLENHEGKDTSVPVRMEVRDRDNRIVAHRETLLPESLLD